MSSYPIRPTFPIDLRSPGGGLVLGRQGGTVTIDTPPSPAQFFAALEALIPGASATVQAAVPSDPSDPTNRAFRLTNFVTPGCALLTFVTATLGLTSVQVANLLTQSALQPK
ncbi:hypothetical protein ACFQE0_13690 [Methylobacterium komagatae]|uniref:Uncharacterized protein n=1 Tax=Methylobacterium komagatae TaxID=374425 RepID=A0ABW2BKP4_9HYPH